MTATTMAVEPGALPARYTAHALAARLEQVPVASVQLFSALADDAHCAALWILTTLRRDDARIWAHVADDGWIDFTAILAEPGWTRAERAALRAAWSIRYIGVESPLGELADWLDDELWYAVLEALRIRRGVSDGGAR